MDRTANFYSRPSHDFHGGSFHVFSGSRRQRGGSIFGSLKKFFSPIAKSLGSAALASGIGLVKDVAQDGMLGKNLKDSLIKHGKARGRNFANTALQTVTKQGLLNNLASMIGKGARTQRRRRKVKRVHRTKRRPSRRRRRPVSRKAGASRKRRKRGKSTPHRNAKRRRTTVANF